MKFRFYRIICAVLRGVLTEYSCEFAQKGNADDLLPLDGVTGPTKEESKQHPSAPWRAGRCTALRQFKF